MCGCKQGTCPGNCGCGCSHVPIHFIAYGNYVAPCGASITGAGRHTAFYNSEWVKVSCADCLAISPMAREALPDLKDPVAVETWLGS